MKKDEIQIVVLDNPDKGYCDIVGHFENNKGNILSVDKDLKGVDIHKDRNAGIDAIQIVLVATGDVIFELVDVEALDLARLQNALNLLNIES